MAPAPLPAEKDRVSEKESVKTMQPTVLDRSSKKLHANAKAVIKKVETVTRANASVGRDGRNGARVRKCAEEARATGCPQLVEYVICRSPIVDNIIELANVQSQARVPVSVRRRHSATKCRAPIGDHGAHGL